jgi:hypothetical protein
MISDDTISSQNPELAYPPVVSSSTPEGGLHALWIVQARFALDTVVSRESND